MAVLCHVQLKSVFYAEVKAVVHVINQNTCTVNMCLRWNATGANKYTEGLGCHRDVRMRNTLSCKCQSGIKMIIIVEMRNKFHVIVSYVGEDGCRV